MACGSRPAAVPGTSRPGGSGTGQRYADDQRQRKPGEREDFGVRVVHQQAYSGAQFFPRLPPSLFMRRRQELRFVSLSDTGGSFAL